MTVIYSHSPVILLLLLIYRTPVILKGVVKVSKYVISKNNVKLTSSYSRLLYVQYICRFYEKTEVPLLPNYLGIDLRPDAFLL